MKFFRFLAPKGIAFKRFENTVLTQIPSGRIKASMSPMDQAAFISVARAKKYGVWALMLTGAAKNERVWNAIEPGDIAGFYTAGRFRYTAPLIYKWRSDTIEKIAGWGAPREGSFSLAFALGETTDCDLGVREYCALVGYEGVPSNSDFHNPEASAEILAVIGGGLPTTPDTDDDPLDDEGDLLVSRSAIPRTQPDQPRASASGAGLCMRGLWI